MKEEVFQFTESNCRPLAYVVISSIISNDTCRCKDTDQVNELSIIFNNDETR